MDPAAVENRPVEKKRPARSVKGVKSIAQKLDSLASAKL